MNQSNSFSNFLRHVVREVIKSSEWPPELWGTHKLNFHLIVEIQAYRFLFKKQRSVYESRQRVQNDNVRESGNFTFLECPVLHCSVKVSQLSEIRMLDFMMQALAIVKDNVFSVFLKCLEVLICTMLGTGIHKNKWRRLKQKCGKGNHCHVENQRISKLFTIL